MLRASYIKIHEIDEESIITIIIIIIMISCVGDFIYPKHSNIAVLSVARKIEKEMKRKKQETTGKNLLAAIVETATSIFR